MKQFLSACVFAALTIFATGCSDESQTPAGPNSMGSLNPTVMVCIGNSITAGYQDGALFESAQQYSFPMLLAKQLGTSIVQPIMPDPGTGSRITIVSMNPVTIASGSSTMVAPVNIAHAAPFNNLGIPGSILYDATDQADVQAKSVTRKNPFFALVLRDQNAFGKSMIEQALKLNPTLITFWLGNNDVLGFATSGGTSPASPTPASTFDLLYGNSLAALRTGAPNAAIVVGTIPEVTSIPFFTTVGPSVAQTLKANAALLGLPTLPIYYQTHGTNGPAGIADSTNLMRQKNVLLPLTAMSYAPLIGKPTGQWYRDIALRTGLPLPAVIAPGIDTTKPFGLHPQNPWPDALTLDIAEQTTAANATQAYNASIIAAVNRYQKAGQPPIAIADINARLAEAAVSGYSSAGETLTADFLKGGIFSLDGVHPSSKGNAMIANEFLRAMNAAYNANIPFVEISKIPGIQVPTGKAAAKQGQWRALPGTFDHIVKLFQN